MQDAAEESPEAGENMRMRSALMHDLVAYIERSGATQAQLTRSEFTQPCVFDLTPG